MARQALGVAPANPNDVATKAYIDNSVTTVVHGNSTSVVRPTTTQPVIWFGTVEPANADASKDVTVFVTPDGTPPSGSGGAPRVGKRVALLGDSITDFNNAFTSYPTTINYSARGFFTWANIILRQRFALVTPSTTDGAWGQSGETAYTILNGGDSASVAASASDIVIVLAGTNDLTDASNFTASQIASNIQGIWNMQLSAGKTVVAGTIWPRNNSDTPQVTQKLHDVNRLLRKQATNTPGVYLCDWYGAYLNAATGLANTSYMIDGVHPNTTGASRMGAVLATVLDRLYPPGDDDLAMDTIDTNNYIGAGALMQGTGGSGATGVFASNWTCYPGTASSVVGSKVARSDLWPGEWQQVVVNPSSNYTLQTYGNIGGVNQPAIGDLIYATCEFETDATNWAATQIQLDITFNGSSNTSYGPGYSEQVLVNRPVNGILATPPIPVPTGATLWKVDIVVSGLSTIRFGRTQLQKVA